MRRRLLHFGVLLAALGAGALVLASGRGFVAVDRPDPVAVFLDGKKAEHEAKIAALSRRGLADELPSIRALVDEHSIDPPPGSRAGHREQAGLLAASLREDASILLAAQGFTAAKIERYRLIGFDPVASAVAVVRGTHDIDDFIVLADTIAVARLAAPTRSVDLGDGFYSSSFLVVTEAWKGPVGNGERVIIRRTSGRRPDGGTVLVSNDFGPQRGKEYLLFLSSSVFEQLSMERNPRPVSRGDVFHVVYGGAFEIIGSGQEPFIRTRNGEVPVDDLRERARNLTSVPAGAAR